MKITTRGLSLPVVNHDTPLEVRASPLAQALAKVTYAAVRYDRSRYDALATIFGGKRLNRAGMKCALRRAFGTNLLKESEIVALVSHLDHQGDGVDGSAFVRQFFAQDVHGRRDMRELERWQSRHGAQSEPLQRSRIACHKGHRRPNGVTSEASCDQLGSVSPMTCEFGYEVADLDGAVDRTVEKVSGDSALIDIGDVEKSVACMPPECAVRHTADKVNDTTSSIATQDINTGTWCEDDWTAHRHVEQRCGKTSVKRPWRGGLADPNSLLSVRLQHKSCIKVHGVLDLSMPANSHHQIQQSSLANLSIESLALAPTLEPPLDSSYADSITKACTKLPWLKALWLTNNTAIATLPPSLCNALYNLRVLGLEGIGLRSLPDTFGDSLHSLDKLYAARNSIHTLPESMAHLNTLSTLDLSKNAFFDLPVHLPTNLAILRLADNALRDVPIDLVLTLRSLKILDLRGNDLDSPRNVAAKRPELRILLNLADQDVDNDTNLRLELHGMLVARAAKSNEDILSETS